MCQAGTLLDIGATRVTQTELEKANFKQKENEIPIIIFANKSC